MERRYGVPAPVYCDIQVGVHIADVSHFIRPGTAIDKEAESRGTTVYLIDKVAFQSSTIDPPAEIFLIIGWLTNLNGWLAGWFRLAIILMAG